MEKNDKKPRTLPKALLVTLTKDGVPFSIGLKNACKTSLSGNLTRTTTFKTKNKKQKEVTHRQMGWGRGGSIWKWRRWSSLKKIVLWIKLKFYTLLSSLWLALLPWLWMAMGFFLLQQGKCVFTSKISYFVMFVHFGFFSHFTHGSCH